MDDPNTSVDVRDRMKFQYNEHILRQEIRSNINSIETRDALYIQLIELFDQAIDNIQANLRAQASITDPHLSHAQRNVIDGFNERWERARLDLLRRRAFTNEEHIRFRKKHPAPPHQRTFKMNDNEGKHTLSDDDKAMVNRIRSERAKVWKAEEERAHNYQHKDNVHLDNLANASDAIQDASPPTRHDVQAAQDNLQAMYNARHARGAINTGNLSKTHGNPNPQAESNPLPKQNIDPDANAANAAGMSEAEAEGTKTRARMYREKFDNRRNS